MKKQIDAANLDDRILKRQRAIISSMTPKERRNPKILDGKRKRRIAAGSGTKPEDINKLLKMHRQMADMMKMMGKRGGLMQRMMGGMGGGGGAAPSAAELEKMQAELARLDPKALESLPRELKEQLPGGLPWARRRPADAAASRPARRRSPVPRLTRPAREEEVSMSLDIPTLETERVRLRGWREEDLDAYAGFIANEATVRFLGGIGDRKNAWRRMAMLVGHWALRGYGPWVIEEKASGHWVGYSGLWNPEGWPEPELMWGLAAHVHGRGYATRSGPARPGVRLPRPRLDDADQLHRPTQPTILARRAAARRRARTRHRAGRQPGRPLPPPRASEIALLTTTRRRQCQ